MSLVENRIYPELDLERNNRHKLGVMRAQKRK